MLQGCYVNRYTVGNGPIGREPAKKVMSTKSIYFFGGLLGVGNNHSGTPPGGENGYQIKTSMNLVDMFVSGLTFGIVSLRTTKMYVKRSELIKSRKANRATQPATPEKTN